ncbi:hypothetical protein PTKIN_Ptkin01aG0354400 [Pterospermum kingtungense]
MMFDLRFGVECWNSLITNDKFKSVEHRVLANRIGPRVSVACIFSAIHFQESNKLYGPMKELISANNPPGYKETLIKDYLSSYCSLALPTGSALDLVLLNGRP